MKTDAQAIARRPVISSLGLICAAQFALVATQLNHQACQAELVRQRQQAVQTTAEALLPQELKKL